MINPFNVAKTDWTRARVEAPDAFSIGQTQRLSAAKPAVYAPTASATASTPQITAPESAPLTWDEQVEQNKTFGEKYRRGAFSASPTSAAVILKTQQMLGKPLDYRLMSVTGPNWEHWFDQAMNQNFAYTYGDDFWKNFYVGNGITQT